MKNKDDYIDKQSRDVERLRHLLEMEEERKKTFLKSLREDISELIRYASLGILSFVFSCSTMTNIEGYWIGMQTRRICAYQDLNRNGLYERLQYITTREDTFHVFPSRADTSGVYPIAFATQFDGRVRERELSKNALENIFREYPWPNVDEIRFED